MSVISLVKQIVIGQFMLYGGGGGGGGDGGAAERKAAEEARVAAAVKKINNVMGYANATPEAVDRDAFNIRNGIFSGAAFDAVEQAAYDAAVAKAQQDAAASKSAKSAYSERAKLYDTIKTDANKRALIDLNKERDITQRNMGFDVARQGLSGGSHDVDTSRNITDTYQQGVMKAAEMAAATSNNARAADDKTRIGLINSIRAGLDEGNAQTQAYAEMRNNADRATENANALTLTGFFDRLNNLSQQRKYNNGLAAGQVIPGTTAPGTTQQKSHNGTVNLIK